MRDKDTIVRGLAHCRKYGTLGGEHCDGVYRFVDVYSWKMARSPEHRSDCPYGRCENGCFLWLVDDAVKLIKEQEETIRGMEEKLRVLEYGDQDTVNGCLTPAV